MWRLSIVKKNTLIASKYKFCSDCIHCRKDLGDDDQGTYYKCVRPNGINLVTGGKGYTFKYCDQERSGDGNKTCGTFGKFFENNA